MEADFTDHILTGHIRKGRIEKNDARVLFLPEIERLRPGSGNRVDIAERFHDLGQDDLVDLIVLGHQNIQPFMLPFTG